jgi:mRNA interferase YafQ
MRKIEYSSAFKKDFKRELKGKYQKNLDSRLQEVVSCLIKDQILAVNYQDHELLGKWAGYRECHLWPNLLLIYQKLGTNLLKLVRLGSHSELFKS